MCTLNGMTPVKIGHIFGKIVMRPEEEISMEAIQNLRLQNCVVEVMVTKFETVFDISKCSYFIIDYYCILYKYQ